MNIDILSAEEALTNPQGLELPGIIDSSEFRHEFEVSDSEFVPTFEVQLDPQRYIEKPESSEVGAIRSRLADGKTTVTLGKFAECIVQGRSFAPALYRDGIQREASWLSQQVFGLDFDHDLTVEVFLERANGLGVVPNLIYSTFNDSPEEPRFRAIYVLKEPVTDLATRMRVLEGLIAAFPEADGKCVDPARLFFGGKSILHFNDLIGLAADDLANLCPSEVDKAGTISIPESESAPRAGFCPTVAPGNVTDSIWGMFKDGVYKNLQIEHLNQIYELTGSHNGAYYVARDPSSKTGDKNPSAVVTDGVNTELPCGFFKSFRDPLNRTLNPFDYLMEYRPEAFPTFMDAAKYLAELTGVAMPEVSNAPAPSVSAGPHFNLLKPMPIGEWLYSAPPLPDWVIENLLERHTVGAVVGDGGIGKGWFLLEYAVCAAVGKAAFPSLPVRQPQRVAFLASEDTRNQLHRRILSIVQHFALNDDEKLLLQKHFYLFADCDGPLLSSKDPEKDTPRYTELMAFAANWKPDLIIIDPKSRWTALNEDSNAEQALFVARLEAVARAANGALLISHHTGKSGKESESGMAARGASSFTHSVRMQANMLHADGKDFIHYPSLGDEGTNGDVIKLVVAKANGKKLDAPIFLSQCGQTGVVSEIVPQDSGSGRTEATLNRCLEALAADETFAFNLSDIKARSSEVKRFKDMLSLDETYDDIGAALTLGLERKLLVLKSMPHRKKEVLALASPSAE